MEVEPGILYYIDDFVVQNMITFIKEQLEIIDICKSLDPQGETTIIKDKLVAIELTQLCIEKACKKLFVNQAELPNVCVGPCQKNRKPNF